jgi:hypothetical protein
MIVALAFLIVVGIGALARQLDSNAERSRKKVGEATDAARLAAEEKVPAEAAAEEGRPESAEAIGQTVPSSKNRRERPPSGSVTATKGWVYLGLCADGNRWLSSFFDDLPDCIDGPVAPPVMITSVRGVKVRAKPSGNGSEVNRLKEHGQVRLLRISSFSQAMPSAPPIYWGEIEVPRHSAAPSEAPTP